MAIQTTQDYKIKEVRLQEIRGILESMTKQEDIDLEKVVSLREEARAIAKDLKTYLKSTFEIQN